MTSYEELHEAFLSLMRENERLRSNAERANFLLRSLDALLALDLEEDPFFSVFDSLQEVLPHDQALVLAESDETDLYCIVARPAKLEDIRFRTGPFLQKVMNGRVSATFRNDNLEEWASIPEDSISSQQPAIYMPIRIRDQRGVLVLLRNVGQPAFDRTQKALAQEFSLLASHAMAALEARQTIEKTSLRAEMAEDANNSKNLFIANMSHELRTPLNAILGFSELIISQALGPIGVPRYAEYLRDIKSSGGHLLNVVNNLLLFAKIEAGQHRYECEILDIEAELGTVIRLLQFDAQNQGVTIQQSFSDMAVVGEETSRDLTAVADRQSLRQILINVIGNAIKFSGDSDRIHLATRTDAATGRVSVCVSDQGCGIPDETLSELGNPFVQAEGAFARRHQGSGLGLAICYGLADAMGATLSIASRVGKGTDVTLSLPTDVEMSETAVA